MGLIIINYTVHWKLIGMSVVCPPELVFDDEIFDLAMNPTAPIVATAMITGELAVCVIKRNHFL